VSEKQYYQFSADGPYGYVIIKYDGHYAFACDWGDCIEEINFIYGYDFHGVYIEYSDPKLEWIKPIMIE